MNRANHWLVHTFKNVKKGTLISDPANNQLVCRSSIYYKSPIFSGSGVSSDDIEFVMHLYFKDGRYKYLLKDFVHQGGLGLLSEPKEYEGDLKVGGLKRWRNRNWNYMKEFTDTKMKALIKSLKNGMSIESEKMTIGE